MLGAIAKRSRYELDLAKRMNRDNKLIRYNLHLLSLQRSTSSIIIGIVVGILGLSSLLGIAVYIALNVLSGLFVCMNVDYKVGDYFIKKNSPFFHNLFADSLERELDMDELSEYFSKFIKFGVSMLCDDQNSNCIAIPYEKSFICGSFWSLCGLKILSDRDIPDEDLKRILAKLKGCLTPTDSYPKNSHLGAKGFRQYANDEWYTANIQSTLYAVQIYTLLYKANMCENQEIKQLLVKESDLESMLEFIKLLWNGEDGFFYNSLNDSSHDLRHTMSSLCTFTLIQRLLSVPKDKVIEKLQEFVDSDLLFKFVKRHFNQDGGVSLVPKGQSHAAAAFCLVGILILMGKLEDISEMRIKLLVIWLLGRISASGGMSGRVGKSNDICYIWWSMATLMLIKKNYRKRIVIFRDKSVPLGIFNFILSSQNKDGGFSSNKSCGKSDPYHSFTALLALCLLDEFLEGSQFSRINPLFALPA